MPRSLFYDIPCYVTMVTIIVTKQLFPFKKKTNRLHSLNHEGTTGNSFSLQNWFLYNVTDWPTSFFYWGKRSALFCWKNIKKSSCSRVCCRITSSVVKCCLKIKSLGLRLGFSISNNISPPRRLFCNKHDNARLIS